MQLLIEYARGEGLKSLFGEVLNENTTMLAMCRELGFEVHRIRRMPDPIVSLDLTTRSFGANDNAALINAVTRSKSHRPTNAP